MTDQEAIEQFRCECPLRIAGLLHLQGLHSHYIRAGWPNRVICLDTQGTIYGGYIPTEAQQHANEVRRQAKAQQEEEEEERT